MDRKTRRTPQDAPVQLVSSITAVTRVTTIFPAVAPVLATVAAVFGTIRDILQQITQAGETSCISPIFPTIRDILKPVEPVLPAITYILGAIPDQAGRGMWMGKGRGADTGNKNTYSDQASNHGSVSN